MAAARSVLKRWSAGSMALMALMALMGAGVLCMLLAACSATTSGSGGINFSSGLAGSTIDHPGNPPTIAANGPTGAYAFVYDNQIWLRQNGENQAEQLTHMAMSKGSIITWGPLVWSPDGRYIAFTVVENLDLASGGSSSDIGPLYYLDIATDPATLYTSAGSGSIFGRSYTWFGDSILLYSNGSGIQMFTAGSADPRTWPVISSSQPQTSGNGATIYTAVGDIQVSGGNLYFTREDIRSPGAIGVVGSAALASIHIGPPNAYSRASSAILANLLPLSGEQRITSLGQVYAAAGGAFVAGNWAIYGSQLAIQRIQMVDVSVGTVTSQLCLLPTAAQNTNSCAMSILDAANTQPITIRPQFAFGGGGEIAYGGDRLYLDGATAASGDSGSPVSLAWSPDGEVAITLVVGSKAGTSGAAQITTNITLVTSSGQSTVLIEGAQNIAWRPS